MFTKRSRLRKRLVAGYPLASWFASLTPVFRNKEARMSSQKRKLLPSRWHVLTTRSRDQHTDCSSDAIGVHGVLHYVMYQHEFVDD